MKILIILSLLFETHVICDQIGIVVNRTEIDPNLDFVNCTVKLKIDKKALKYGIDIDVELRRPVDDFPVKYS